MNEIPRHRYAPHRYAHIPAGLVLHYGSCERIWRDGQRRDDAVFLTESQARRWLAANAARRACRVCTPWIRPLGPVY